MDSKSRTNRQIEDFTDLFLNRRNSCTHVRKAEFQAKNLELEKNIRDLESKVNTLSEAPEELPCVNEDLIVNLGSSSTVSPWLNKYWN